jgi:oligopeptide transport system permease protein
MQGGYLLARYVIKRLAISIGTLGVILFVLFLLLDLMPGSPFNDERLTREQIGVLETKYGLNKPFFTRFLTYAKNTLIGDFGFSYVLQKNMPISAILAVRFSITVRLALQAALLGGLLGLALGLIAALNHGKLLDSLATTVSVLGVSLPSFVFALLLSYFFAYKWKIFPLLYSNKAPFFSSILPSISLSMFTVASIARYTRSEMIEIMNSEYIQFADSKGVSRGALIFRHAFRNAFIGIITVFAPLVVNLMLGSLVVEKIFSIPGIGKLFIEAIQGNDYNIVLAVSFVYCTLFIGVLLLVDLMYVVIDPRIRLAKGEN